jgi:hypothetical protein
MAKSKLLYTNNARTTLLAPISNTDTVLTVQTVSGFPTITDSTQSFLVTLDDDVNVEIVRVYGVSGNTFTGCLRGQEGTTARAFLATSRAEHRLTAQSLNSFARLEDRLADYASIETLTNPAQLNGNSAFCTSVDSGDMPIIALNAGNKWRLLNYPDLIKVGVSGSGATTTSINLTSASGYLIDTTSRVYVIQFTSGLNVGQCRFITTIGSGSISWSTALPNIPVLTDSFELYRCASALKVPTGGGSDRIFFENDQQIWSDYSIPTGRNASSTGPVSVNSGVTVTVPVGSSWSIV